jgi:hypothetical protein
MANIKTSKCFYFKFTLSGKCKCTNLMTSSEKHLLNFIDAANGIKTDETLKVFKCYDSCYDSYVMHIGSN